MNHVSFHRADYPRPGFVRDSFFNLNGPWSFAFDDEDEGILLGYPSAVPASKRTIIVPFAYQTKSSKIADPTYHKIVWYWRKVRFPEGDPDKAYRLVFEGSDYKTDVYVNGHFVGTHQGGYTRFYIDLRGHITPGEEFLLAIRVEDDNDTFRPRGKQAWRSPWGCWYTPTTGIWKTLWAEEISKTHLESMLFTPIPNRIAVEGEYEIANYKDNLSLKVTASFRGKKISSCMHRLYAGKGKILIDLTVFEEGFGRIYWGPNDPALFELELTLYEGGEEIDLVKSYTAYRVFEAKGDRFYLNLNPYYLRFVLEQGYLPRSGMTYESEEQIIHELNLIQALGFNGIRMHQKIEDERFYYLCDIMGILTSFEMPSPYAYDSTTVVSTSREWVDAIRQFYNHPSIVMWVGINESWGTPDILVDKSQQAFAKSLCELARAIDPTRPIISNDGWENVGGDIITFHNYSQNPDEFASFYQNMEAVLGDKNFQVNKQTRASFADGHHYEGQPILIDEFGGVAYQKKGDSAWGYGTVNSEADYLSRIEALVKAIVTNDRIAGFCYTQITDVEAEQNGLLDVERNPKADIAAYRRIFTLDGK